MPRLDPEWTHAKDAFARSIFNPDSLLATAIEWIADNLEPAAVFSDDTLSEWAKARGFTITEDQ
jgi:hypothetical protein